MRNSCKVLIVVAAAAVAMATGACLQAAPGDDDEGGAEAAKLEKEALDKAVTRGKDLFHGKEIGSKACASCHENAEKPNLDLKTRAFAYPKYSRAAKNVVTMSQKINEMVKSKSRGKELDLAGADVAAIEAYVLSLKAK